MVRARCVPGFQRGTHRQGSISLALSEGRPAMVERAIGPGTIPRFLPGEFHKAHTIRPEYQVDSNAGTGWGLRRATPTGHCCSQAREQPGK